MKIVVLVLLLVVQVVNRSKAIHIHSNSQAVLSSKIRHKTHTGSKASSDKKPSKKDRSQSEDEFFERRLTAIIGVSISCGCFLFLIITWLLSPIVRRSSPGAAPVHKLCFPARIPFMAFLSFFAATLVMIAGFIANVHEHPNACKVQTSMLVFFLGTGLLWTCLVGVNMAILIKSCNVKVGTLEIIYILIVYGFSGVIAAMIGTYGECGHFTAWCWLETPIWMRIWLTEVPILVACAALFGALIIIVIFLVTASRLAPPPAIGSFIQPDSPNRDWAAPWGADADRAYRPRTLLPFIRALALLTPFVLTLLSFSSVRVYFLANNDRSRDYIMGIDTYVTAYMGIYYFVVFGCTKENIKIWQHVFQCQKESKQAPVHWSSSSSETNGPDFSMPEDKPKKHNGFKPVNGAPKRNGRPKERGRENGGVIPYRVTEKTTVTENIVKDKGSPEKKYAWQHDSSESSFVRYSRH
eukprot:Platyproteum_vivax@DN6217_c0_g1_i1.p1